MSSPPGAAFSMAPPQQQQQQSSMFAPVGSTSLPAPPPPSTSSTTLPPSTGGSTSLSSLVTLPPPFQLQAQSSGVAPFFSGNSSLIPTAQSSPGGIAANIQPPHQQQQQQQQPGGIANIHSQGVLFGLGGQLPPLTTGLDSQPPPAAAGVALNANADPLSVLNDLVVPLESIRPSNLLPMQIVTKNNVSVTFHFAKNCPAASVRVIVISIISTSTLPVSNFQLQAAVPKVMRVKLQPPTGTELAAYNPILPPQSISQVLLLANPSQAKIRLKYRVSFLQSGQEVVETGEVADFPAGL